MMRASAAPDRAIRKYRPEIVLANALDDRHPDHGRAGHLISESCFLSGLRRSKRWIVMDWPRSTGALNMYFTSSRTGMPSPPLSMTSALFLRPNWHRSGPIPPFHTGNYGKEEPQTYISTPEFLNSIIGAASDVRKNDRSALCRGVHYGENDRDPGFDDLVRLDT